MNLILIPNKVSEKEENIDKCIFRGHLRGEPSVYLVLTGGCPFEDHFEVCVLERFGQDTLGMLV
jgi:hypothetical protein